MNQNGVMLTHAGAEVNVLITVSTLLIVEQLLVVGDSPLMQTAWQASGLRARVDDGGRCSRM
jgi:hypothetical protein